MVFHEITKQAIERALEETRDIDDRLVDAQETRRILDRLYGYEVSPVLWRKVMKGLSAGRVQSVATRLVVERERERIEFRAAEYWDIVATFDPGEFDARLDGGRRPARSRRAATSPATGRSSTADAVQLDEDDARGLADGARRRRVRRPLGRAQAVHAPPGGAVHDLDAAAGGEPQAPLHARSTRCASPSASTRTATSPTCAPTRPRWPRRAVAAARDQARELYGADSVPDAPRHYNAEGEERAGGARGDPPRRRQLPHCRTRCAREVERDEAALYDLVWKRTVASQMADARGETVSVRVGATARPTARDAEFGTAGTVITFRGFMLAYEEGRDEAVAAGRGGAPPAAAHRGRRAVGDRARARVALDEPARPLHGGDARAGARGARHRPPVDLRVDPRARSSTAATSARQGQALVPTFLAFAVTNLLEQHFGRLVDYEFTALMEDDLDRIAAGDEERTAWLKRFYFGERRRRGPEGARVATSATSTPARSTRSRSATASSCASAATGPTSSANGQRVDDPRRHRARRADGRARPRSCSRRASTSASSASNPETGRTVDGQERPLRPVRDGGRRGRREAAHRVALQVDVARDGDARGGAAAASRCRAPSAPTRGRARRSSSRTAATGRSSSAAPTRGRSSPRSSCSRSRSTRRSPCSPSRSSAGAGRPRSRCASSATTRSAASRSWSRTAASAPTSPTARRTRASAPATTVEDADVRARRGADAGPPRARPGRSRAAAGARSARSSRW